MDIKNLIYRIIFFSCCFLCVSIASQGYAQSWPIKPIRLVVPFPPGGATDIFARQIGQKLTERLSQPVIIENQAGAGGNIGTGNVARASADGYTLLLSPGSTLAINPVLFSKIPFDPIKDFTPISELVVTPYVIVVHPSVPARNLNDLIKLAKLKPGGLSYASSGIGQATHLAGVVFNIQASTSMLHVPYKGAGPATADLLGGQVSMMFANLGSMLPYIKSGKVFPLAVTTLQRNALLPDVPTVAESGLQGYEVSEWFGLLAPVGTSSSIIKRLNTEVTSILASPEFSKELLSQGFVPIASSPEVLANLMKEEMVRWAKIIKQEDIRAD